MDKTKQVTRLVVLGNGFDLACGANSTFDGYLRYFDEGEPIIKAVKQAAPPKESINYDWWRTNMFRVLNKEMITEDNPFYGLTQYQPATIWDALLILDMDRLKTWQDVESKIKSVITNFELEQLSHRKQIWPSWRVRDDELEPIYIAFLACYCREYEMQREDFLGFLYEELQSFELGFVEYLETETGHGHGLKPAYLKKSTRLLSWLTEDEWTNILNFNYSLPAAENWNEPSNYARELNIHGNLDQGNIIIGIDQTGTKQSPDELIPVSSPYYRFTKTYQLMVDAHDYTSTTVLNPGIQTIVFFGHSLSHADYSYFQSLFDFYNIYGTQVTLKFFYTIWDPNKVNEIKREQFNRIASLFQAYGKTLDNKDHGKNLMHKLLLERRLQIIRIKDKWKEVDYSTEMESVYDYLG